MLVEENIKWEKIVSHTYMAFCELSYLIEGELVFFDNKNNRFSPYTMPLEALIEVIEENIEIIKNNLKKVSSEGSLIDQFNTENYRCTLEDLEQFLSLSTECQEKLLIELKSNDYNVLVH